MANIQDWCISRQLWWGHRIPAWHCGSCHKITVPKPGEDSDPTACTHCGSAEIRQETDVLDTWFSSGLLPISVFGWPFADGKPSADFTTFYPTSLLVTGFDILFFWVARMIMLGCWFALDVPMTDGSKRELKDAVPFKDVYIHALVRDANREKMSKTKGNVIDPIEIVKQYGTDAVRFTLASMASPGTDIAFNVARTEGYRAFANKIWNAARFIFMNVNRAAEVGITVDPSAYGNMPTAPQVAPLEDRWICARFQEVTIKVNQALDNYRFDDAANNIYQFFWGSFCDWYLEIVKLRLDFSANGDTTALKAALSLLLSVFESSLRILSPFMPFMTEEIWHSIHEGNLPASSIALCSFPKGESASIDRIAIAQMVQLQYVVSGIREYRKDLGVPEKQSVPAYVLGVRTLTTYEPGGSIEENCKWIERLSNSTISEVNEPLPPECASLNWRDIGPTDIAIDFKATIDIPAECERLAKEIAKLEKGLAAAERQLGNEGFLAKAPANIVEGLKKQEAENRQLLGKAKAAFDALGCKQE
jgi:valyl-tRNA synthetase